MKTTVTETYTDAGFVISVHHTGSSDLADFVISYTYDPDQRQIKNYYGVPAAAIDVIVREANFMKYHFFLDSQENRDDLSNLWIKCKNFRELSNTWGNLYFSSPNPESKALCNQYRNYYNGMSDGLELAIKQIRMN